MTTYRWDIIFAESAHQRAERVLAAGLRLRKDGGLDRRYSDMRWLARYNEGLESQYGLVRELGAAPVRPLPWVEAIREDDTADWIGQANALTIPNLPKN